MLRNIFTAFFLSVLLSGLILTNISLAMTAEEYCDQHEKSGAPGTCESDEEDNCAILTTNLGTEECKKCGDGGCEMTDCDKDCPNR